MTTAPALEGSLLLCLDLQPTFLRAMPESESLLGRCRFALSAAAGVGLAVAFTEQMPSKLGTTEASLRALAPAAAAHAKDTFSALAPGSAVCRALNGGRALEHVLLCGLETPVCVYQTALDAQAAGLSVTILSDAVGARRPADARVSLEALARSGVHVLPSETVFYAILAGASHPFFKPYTELVKRHA